MMLNELAHRIRRLAGAAVIKLVNDSGAVQLVQLDMGPRGADGPKQLRDNTPVLQHFGFTSNPPGGSDATIVALGGDANQMVVIATGHRAYRIQGLPEGAAAIYDKFGHHVRLDANGIHIQGDVVIDGDVTINGAFAVNGDSTLTGNLAVTGDSTLTGDALVDGDLAVTGDTGLDGYLQVVGDILDRAGANTVTVASVRTAYNAHKHTGVQAGGATSGGTDHTAT